MMIEITSNDFGFFILSCFGIIFLLIGLGMFFDWRKTYNKNTYVLPIVCWIISSILIFSALNIKYPMVVIK